jgi:K+-sensing histidine kinase KdpD
MGRDETTTEPADPTDTQRAANNAVRLSVLAQASHAFATVVTDYRLLLDKIARTTADLVGDGCIVTLIDEDGETLFNAASAHRDPALEEVYRAYLAGMGISKTTSATVSAAVVRSGEPKLVPEIQPADLVARTDDALKPLVARLNVHSFVVVPIRARQKVIGTLSLVRSRPDCGYTSDDLTLLRDLADRAGLAIDNSRLYDDLERRVRQRTAELEAANRELEAFSYAVAHDLRAPLRSIDGFSQALVEECAGRLGHEAMSHLDRVRGAAQRMSRLIDDLLSLSRLTRGQLRRARVDLSEIAHTVLARLREAQPDRALEIAVEPGIVAEGDPHLVEVVLTNLLGTSPSSQTRIEERLFERRSLKVNALLSGSSH